MLLPVVCLTAGEGRYTVPYLYGKAGGVMNADAPCFPNSLRLSAWGHSGYGAGRSHCSFDTARKGREIGVVPHTICTDLVKASIDFMVFSLPATISRFLAIGYTLEELVAMTTINPARILVKRTKGQPSNRYAGRRIHFRVSRRSVSLYRWSN